MIRVAGLLVCVVSLFSIVGCSQYDDDYQYAPRPAIADIPATQPQSPPPVSANATIIGVRYADEDNHIPASIEVRLEIDNNGPDAVVFDPMSMELRNSQLVRLGPPIVKPPTPVTLNPSQSALVSAYFPFPAGSSYDTIDMSTFQLRWYVQLDSKSVGQAANFTRVWAPYYGPGPGPYWYYGPPPPPFFWYGYGGVVVIHRR